MDTPRAYEGFDRNAVLLAMATAPQLRRAQLAGALVAAGTAAAIVLLPPHDAPLFVWALIAAVPATGAGVATALAAVPNRTLRAFATLSWFSNRALARFRERTGSAIPTSGSAIRSWLAAAPPGQATAAARIVLLASIGELETAERELAALPPPETDRDRLEQAALRQLVTFLATGDPGLGRFDEVVRSMPPGGELAHEARIAYAVADVRGRLAAGDPDWQAPLIEAGRGLGAARWASVGRATGGPLVAMLAIVSLAAATVATLAGLRTALGG